MRDFRLAVLATGGLGKYSGNAFLLQPQAASINTCTLPTKLNKTGGRIWHPLASHTRVVSVLTLIG